MGTIDKRPVAAAAAFQAVIVAGINLLASFGLLTLTTDQLASLNGFMALVLPAFFAVLIRNKVVAVTDLEWVEDEDGEGK